MTYNSNNNFTIIIILITTIIHNSINYMIQINKKKEVIEYII